VRGLVAGRHYTPAHDDMTCTTNPQTQVLECTPVHHAAQYSLFVRTSEGLASVSTDEAGYATAQDGQALTYSRARTRWSDYTWGDSYSPEQE
jgi:hypothetical protein